MSSRSRCSSILCTSRLHLRGALWKMLRSILVDPKITSLFEAMYDTVESPVVMNGQLKEWCKV